MILEIFRNSFTLAMREKGLAYHYQEKLQLETSDENFSHYSAYGNDRYDVKLLLDLENDHLKASCTCHSFKRSHSCKHVWAALIEADADYFFEDIEDQVYKNLRYVGVRDVSEFGEVKSEEDLAIMLMKRLRAKSEKVKKKEKFKKLSYVIDNFENYYHSEKLEIKVFYQNRLKNGEWSSEKLYSFNRDMIEAHPRIEDRAALSFLTTYDQDSGNRRNKNICIEDIHAKEAIAKLINTGNAFYQDFAGRRRIKGLVDNKASVFFHIDCLDSEEVWSVQPRVKIEKELINVFKRNHQRMLNLGLLFYESIVYGVDTLGLEAIFCDYNAKEEYRFRYLEKDKFKLFLKECLPTGTYKLPKNVDLVVNQISGKPIFKISVLSYKTSSQIIGEIFFDYDGELGAVGEAINIEDKVYENSVLDLLVSIEGLDQYFENNMQTEFIIEEDKLVDVVAKLTDAQIEVYAKGKQVKHMSDTQVSIETSGIDWFEIKGKVKFGQEYVALPDLLKGSYKNNLIPLSNGQVGVVSYRWLEKQRALMEMANVTDNNEAIRIHKSHAIVVDHMFREHERETDDYFKNFVTHIKDFKNVKVLNESKRFKGELREYQREGLSWLNFLKELRLGGCLADDMGLGKTIQVLSQLDHHHEKAKGRSLIVAPRSLVFNWFNEAKKFCPHLKVEIYDGSPTQRIEILKRECDVLICTYGVVRRDIQDLKKLSFEYVVLDEAQAIKNARAQVSKCVCMLNSMHRLALSGTPVENSIDDIFSIFNFLSPGMFNKSQVSTDRMENNKVMESLRPFILRRLKEDVLDDLPPKTESVIYCDLEGEHKKSYDDLKNYYKKKLKQKVKEEGINKSKIHVLQALLRLRQAANHPGLVNEYEGESAKLNILFDKLDPLIKSKKKVVIFSQFVKFLDIIKNEMDQRDITYEYLDGSSRKREEIVRRFKTCQRTNLFLISIKAGGTGLNLTEADYCFILDPWWNPAVEAQAIDRIHRIGQKNKVFAYKLIARGTVEDKIVELQDNKKEISQNVLSADGSFIKSLSSDQLNYLLT